MKPEAVELSRCPDEIAQIAVAGLQLSEAALQSQLVQSQHRARIALAWDVREGQRLLELGCGQGDMTAVLAAMVGSSGHVTAIDPGSPDYGAPVTLGEAIARLTAGPLGGRLNVQLGTGLSSPTLALPFEHYDAAVMAHCSWYFASQDSLVETFSCLAGRTRQLLLSEWDIRAESPSQIPHLLTVLLRRALSVPLPDDNIRTPISQTEMIALLSQAGWSVEQVTEIDSNQLQDGGWEVDMMLDRLLHDPALGSVQLMSDTNLEKLRTALLRSQIESMPSYALVCRR
ncbi:methyltransferase domain-containing protein [Paracoccus aminophilus]|uniref:Protein-L-isoaspartate(D-aspartate) O-methyltransferase n=1 Tax=Paracoccus aminophilus JCM 7686 TaxID=1367847 RepID=S5YW43_PARAH|nr:methyltransferase domain-containing protein [Paracoccus aminophilus]AGT09456.1 protein-L-isoaspartate(D-aspartate) O-methyltransferase [Paracoccus aminophilus JCM 7686]